MAVSPRFSLICQRSCWARSSLNPNDGRDRLQRAGLKNRQVSSTLLNEEKQTTALIGAIGRGRSFGSSLGAEAGVDGTACPRQRRDGTRRGAPKTHCPAHRPHRGGVPSPSSVYHHPQPPSAPTPPELSCPAWPLPRAQPHAGQLLGSEISPRSIQDCPIMQFPTTTSQFLTQPSHAIAVVGLASCPQQHVSPMEVKWIIQPRPDRE